LLFLLLVPAVFFAQDWGAGTRDAMESKAEGHYLRGIEHYEADVYDSAVFYFQRSVDIREELFGAAPNLKLGKANHLLGSSLRLKGESFAAEPPLLRAIAVFQSLDTVPAFRVTRSRNDLVDAWTDRGDFGLAERMAGLIYRDAMATDDVENVVSGLLGQSNLFLRKEQFGASKAASRKLQAYIREQSPGMTPDDRAYYHLLAQYAGLNLGTALTETDSLELAEDAYLRAIPTLKEWDDAPNLQVTYNNLAGSYVESGRVRLAEKYLGLARALQPRTNDRRIAAITEDNYGELFLATGRPREALGAFQRAQAILLPGYVAESHGDVPPDGSLRYASYQTDLFRYLGDQAEALDALIAGGADYTDAQLAVYRAADRLIDFIRANHDGGNTKLFWRERVMPLYEAAIRRCHASDRPAEAFAFFEKTKAVLLYEALADSDALKRLPDSLRQRDLLLARRLAEVADDPTAFLAARSALEKSRNDLANDFPVYARAGERFEVPEPADFHRRHLAPKGKTLVHYFFGAERVYALTLNDDGPRTFDLGPTDSLTRIAQAALTWFAGPGKIENDPGGYATAAYACYGAFLLPLHPPPGPLLIIPDGPLTYLPFPALLTEVGQDGSLGRLPYLLRQHPVSFTHSAGLLERIGGTVNQRAGITGFAPFTDGTAMPDYPTLPFDQDELSSLDKRFDVTLLRDSEATLERFTAEAPSAAVLHLSTHAFSSLDGVPPHLAFYDSLLYLRDLYLERVNAEMVVLSACRTNVGQLAVGEGVLGLGRGFFQAGARSVVASLWNVNAFGSGHVLRGFYDQLNRGKPRGTALHAAQLAYLDDPAISRRRKSPYLWAGFNYYGPDTPIAISRLTVWSITPQRILAGLMVSGLLWLGIRSRRARK